MAGLYAGLIELVTGVLVALGLFTRIAALLASGAMAYAYSTVHLPHGFLPMTNGGEPAVLYCFAFFLLAFIGPGRFALETRRSAIGGRWRRPRRGYESVPLSAQTGRPGGQVDYSAGGVAHAAATTSVPLSAQADGPGGQVDYSAGGGETVVYVVSSSRRCLG